MLVKDPADDHWSGHGEVLRGRRGGGLVDADEMAAAFAPTRRAAMARYRISMARREVARGLGKHVETASRLVSRAAVRRLDDRGFRPGRTTSWRRAGCSSLWGGNVGRRARGTWLQHSGKAPTPSPTFSAKASSKDSTTRSLSDDTRISIRS